MFYRMNNFRNWLCSISIVAMFSTGLCYVGLNNELFTQQNKEVGDCKACVLFVAAFKKGLQDTLTGNHAGGDADWEKNKLNPYYKSNLRYTEISDKICNSTSVECSVFEKLDDYIESNWEEFYDGKADFHRIFCIEKLKVCCPVNHYGPDCKPCLGGTENPCNGKGKCRGDGTRKGDGTCLCDTGYTGDLCDACSIGYYLSSENSTNICLPCDKSCSDGCSDASAKSCNNCAPGYIKDKQGGCIDANECDYKDICKRDHFCLNSVGSYICVPCDKSCDGCRDEGPDMCRRCAKGYSKKGEFCIADRENEFEHTEQLTTSSKVEL